MESDTLTARKDPPSNAASAEFRILTGALKTLTFRPVTPHNGFGTTRESVYGALVIGLVLATVAEMTVVHLVMSAYFDAGVIAHALVALLHAYGVMWVLGDWRAMKETGHRLDDDSLLVELGMRWRGEIPLTAIRDVKVGEVEVPDTLAGEKRPDHVLAVTPMDAPNVTVTLDEPATLSTYFGLTRSGSEIQFRVEEPAAFAERIRAGAGLHDSMDPRLSLGLQGR